MNKTIEKILEKIFIPVVVILLVFKMVNFVKSPKFTILYYKLHGIPVYEETKEQSYAKKILYAGSAINKKIKEYENEMKVLGKRISVGLEDSAKYKLLDTKTNYLKRMYGNGTGTYGGYTSIYLECDEYCKNVEDIYSNAKCKKYVLDWGYIYRKYVEIQNLLKEKTITKEEYNKIEAELIEQNEILAEELNKLENWKSLSQDICAEDEAYKNLNKGSNKNQETKTEFSQDETNKIMDDYSQRTAFIANEIYKELNVSIKCYKLWHRLGGEDLDKQTECSYAALKKIDKYCNEHQDDYVCFMPD